MQQSSHSAHSMGLPAYYNPYMTVLILSVLTRRFDCIELLCIQVPAHLQVQQSSHSAPSMGLPAYYNPYMAMPGQGMVPLAMPSSSYGPPNPMEAAAAHGFSSPSQFRPPPIDATRAHSSTSQQGSPLSPAGQSNHYKLCVFST